jgi:hypothetical protein
MFIFLTRHWLVSSQLHAPAALPPEEKARYTNRIGLWVVPRADMGRYAEVRVFDCSGTRTATPRLSCPCPVDKLHAFTYNLF